MKGHTFLVVLAALTGACSVVFEYPASADEDTPAQCTNGADDDFDGLSDCEDANCDGHCPETGARCGDGRNNDGDEASGVPLVDRADPGCFGIGHTVVGRCAYRPGAVYELRRWSAYEAFLTPEWVTSGSVDEGDDGPGWRDVIRLLPGQYIETRAPVTGSVEHMGVEMILSATPGSRLVVSFVSTRFGTVAEAHFVVAPGGASTMWIATPDGATTSPVSAGIETVADRFAKVQFFTSGPKWSLRSITTGGPRRDLPIDAMLPRDEALTLRIEARGEDLGMSASVMFARIARASYDTCGRAQASPMLNAPMLRGAADGDDLRCVIVGERPHASRDDAIWVAARNTIGDGDVGLAWVEAFTRFEGALFDPVTRTLRFFASDDCDAFRTSEPVVLPSTVEAPRLVGFDASVTPEGVTRYVYVLGTDAIGERTLVVLASQTGVPDSYVESAVLAWPHPAWIAHRPVSAGRIGDDSWVLGPGAVPGDVALRIWSGDGSVEAIDPFITPSGTAGSFDRFRVEGASLVVRGERMSSTSLRARAYFYASLHPTDPGFESAPTRSGIEWMDVVFGEETP